MITREIDYSADAAQVVETRRLSFMHRALADKLPIVRPLASAIGRLASAVLLTALLAAPAHPALALSEIKRENVPAAPDHSAAPSGNPIEKQDLPPLDQVPIPNSTTAEPPDGSTPGDEEEPDSAQPAIDPDAPIPAVEYDLSTLPAPVRALHDKLIEACKSGDIERLRPFLAAGDDATQLSFGGIDGDPIEYLKETSGDKEGAEILAILEEVLSAGFVHIEPGTPNDMYVWPYFFAVPLDRLTPPQKVELFKIVTAGDYEDMKSFGSYIFYRVGITPEGEWSFFVAGD